MRSAYLRFLLLVLCLAAAPRLSAGDSEADPRILEVEPDVFCVIHAYPWPSNSLVAVMEDGEVLMIDTPYTPEATRKVLAWIEGKFGKRRITAITTHFHVDRLGGNAALVERGRGCSR
jgi:metallo-beta-lactamase class B